MASLFTRIIQGEIPAEIVYQDEHVVAFKDIHPQAPIHLLLVPRQEHARVTDLPSHGDHQHLLNAAQAIAGQLGVEDFRLVINNGVGAGQSVDHLHMHFLAGRPLSWPPG